jgi:dihydroflavonol-4-reductase
MPSASAVSSDGSSQSDGTCMKIAVTGATGFIGTHLCRRLVDDGHEVIALRRESSDTSTLDELAIPSVVGDVTDVEALDRLVRGSDAVAHVAAVLSYGRGHTREHQRVNVEGTRTVVDACRRHGTGRLLGFGSVASFGIPRKPPANEESTPDLRGLSYQASKRAAENLVLASELDALVVCPSSVQGPDDGDFRGRQLPDGVRRRKVVPCFTGGVNVVHVDDVVDGAVAALGRGRSGERYLLGGENLSWREMARIAADELGVKRVLVPVPRLVSWAVSRVDESRLSRDGHMLLSSRLYFSSAKAEQELEYRYRSYREIVREYIEWIARS